MPRRPASNRKEEVQSILPAASVPINWLSQILLNKRKKIANLKFTFPLADSEDIIHTNLYFFMLVRGWRPVASWWWVSASPDAEVTPPGVIPLASDTNRQAQRALLNNTAVFHNLLTISSLIPTKKTSHDDLLWARYLNCNIMNREKMLQENSFILITYLPKTSESI